MPTTKIIIIILIALASLLVNFAVIWFILRAAVNSRWNILADRFPAQPPEPDAVTKRFQSLNFGVLNLGGCVTITVDSNYLHLQIWHFFAWIGARPMSVPWAEIKPLKGHNNKITRVKILDLTVRGPAWCLSLADQSLTPNEPRAIATDIGQTPIDPPEDESLFEEL